MYELNLTNTFPLLVGFFMIKHFNYTVSEILPVKHIPVKMIKFNRKEYLEMTQRVITEYKKEKLIGVKRNKPPMS